MATNLKAKRNKLYFDLAFGGTNGSTVITNAVVACTQYTSGTVKGDRYGNLMTAIPALTGSASNQAKTRAAVSAWFQPNLVTLSNATSTGAIGVFAVSFVQATGTAYNRASLAALRYLTVGNTAVAANAGHDAIYSVAGAGAALHFSVLVRRGRGASASTGAGVSVSGTLYVQRQHTIEV